MDPKNVLNEYIWKYIYFKLYTVFSPVGGYGVFPQSPFSISCPDAQIIRIVLDLYTGAKIALVIRSLIFKYETVLIKIDLVRLIRTPASGDHGRNYKTALDTVNTNDTNVCSKYVIVEVHSFTYLKPSLRYENVFGFFWRFSLVLLTDLRKYTEW